MFNYDAMNVLAQIALRSVEQSRVKEVASAFDTASIPFDCKLWRSTGFSDSTIYRISNELGTFAIRSWPDRFWTPPKVAFWLSINNSFAVSEENLRAVGASNPVPFPGIYGWHSPGEPAASLLHFENHLWTLCDWVQGQSIAVGNVSKVLVQHLATVLGRLHKHSRDALDPMGEPLGQQRMASSSIRERLESLKNADHRLFVAITVAAFLSTHNLAERMMHCLAIVLERKSNWLRFLMICESQLRPCHWIVRDLWRENVLLDESLRFSSIVDLGASRFDWPGLDFTRLFGSLSYEVESCLNADTTHGDDLWMHAYAAYIQEHPSHSIPSLDECRMLNLVSNGLSILQWLRWVNERTIDLSDAGKSERVVKRIAELCDRFLREA